MRCLKKDKWIIDLKSNFKIVNDELRIKKNEISGLESSIDILARMFKIKSL